MSAAQYNLSINTWYWMLVKLLNYLLTLLIMIQ